MCFKAPEVVGQVMKFVEPRRQLRRDSVQLVKRCAKPESEAVPKTAAATAGGFATTGFPGFFCEIDPYPY